MQILYDGEIFLNQAYGGINTYFVQLLSRFPDDFTADLFVSRSSNARFPQFSKVKIDYLHTSKMWPRTIGKRLDRYLCKKRIDKCSADIFHPTYYNLSMGVPIEKVKIPIVVSVWDMIHELYPQQYDPVGEKANIKRQAILAANTLLCISENTKNDLMSLYKIPESRIKVILLAPGVMKPKLNTGLHHPTPYFLYVGGRKFHKNFCGLIKSFANISTIVRDVKLLVVGRKFENHEITLIRSLGVLERVQNIGDIDDDCLASVYQQSIALVYPSFYEGFGIPPLDAMTCGTVAIVANRSCLPEVAGEGALFFDPDMPDDLEDKMLTVIRNASIRDDLIEKGKNWVKRYSWDKTAAQVFDAYRSIVG